MLLLVSFLLTINCVIAYQCYRNALVKGRMIDLFEIGFD